MRVTAMGLALVLAVGTSCTCVKRLGYTGFGRDGWQQPERVIQVLEIRSGDRIADLGAGGGYFTFRLADAVGADGAVYAVDVDQPMLEDLAGRIAENGDGNVSTILAEYGDPLLPEDGVDLIFTVNTYHHLEDRTAYFEGAKRYLRPGGRIAIIDHDGSGGLFAKWFGHFTSTDEIRSEMQAAGYRLEAEHDFLERQSFLVFSAN